MENEEIKIENVQETPAVEETVVEEIKQENTDELVMNLKKEFEEKLLQQKLESEKRIKQRDDIIKQLMTGDTVVQEKTIADELNAKRIAQNKY